MSKENLQDVTNDVMVQKMLKHQARYRRRTIMSRVYLVLVLAFLFMLNFGLDLVFGAPK